MRVALSLIAFSLATGAAADVPRAGPRDSQRVCRDRIEQVRAASGLPKLDRDNATDEKPLLIAAVDKRIGGCALMVRPNNRSDVRPLPPPAKGPVRLRKLQKSSKSATSSRHAASSPEARASIARFARRIVG